jgi:hypothetical protein
MCDWGFQGCDIMRRGIAGCLFVATLVATALAQDPGWPRQVTKQGSTLIYYQPQVDDWKDFSELDWRMAITLTPAGGKQTVGVVEMHGHTDIDNDNKAVLISNLQVVRTHFPSLDPATAEQMGQLVKTFLPPTVTISLHRLVAVVKKAESVPGVPVKNDPPAIVVSYKPAILLSIDGDPVLQDIPKTKLKFVVNTSWPLFVDESTYYLLVGQQWITAGDLDGPWSPTTKLPKDMSKVPEDATWAALRKVIPPPANADGVIPMVFYSNRPAEIILFDGRPVYAKVPGTQLVYATNTSSFLFVHSPSNQYYYLTAGRWFRADSLTGPWTFATPNLPPDFAQIPPSSPVSEVLASVPGTEEAKDAVLLAQIPTTMTVSSAAATQAKVTYSGPPKFDPISGTSLAYATNTQDKVIQVGDVYYLCLQGVWFMSTTPQGPWTVANSVPQVIYTIPPSSPVYNVTYVTQVTTSSGNVQSSYTAGYLGAFVIGASVGAIVASGSGYYYPPYIYRPPYGYPVYYPCAPTYGAYGVYGTTAHYNTATGAYGVSQTAYGPYGSATRSASYNPYTGTSTRTASASTPYGSRSAGEAYNPYTGNYAATKQGSSPTAQWGSSVATNGSKSAYSQHYSTAQGSVGSVQTSTGGKGVATSSAYGSSYAGKNSSGDMYAGHDGNVYKNTGSGWQTYNNGSWNSVKTPTTASVQQQTQTYQQQHPSASSGTSSTNQAEAQQKAQTYQQQHPSASSGASSTNQAAAQEKQQSYQQHNTSMSQHPQGSGETQGLQQEAQNRQRGAQQSQRFQQFQRSGGGGWGGGRRR